MAKISIYNSEGKTSRTIDLDDAIFGVRPKNSVIHQVYLAQMANVREPWADTKDRGEVRGGGKKPWKQKGTGRARHGSIRSPIWKGGGVTFGPLSVRNYKQKINKKMNQAALRMCLSDRALSEHLVAVESLPVDGKTKTVTKFRRVLPGDGKTTLLLVHDERPEMILRATRNIPRLHVQRAQDVNVVDILRHQYIVASIESIAMLEKRLRRS